MVVSQHPRTSLPPYGIYVHVEITCIDIPFTVPKYSQTRCCRVITPFIGCAMSVGDFLSDFGLVSREMLRDWCIVEDMKCTSISQIHLYIVPAVHSTASETKHVSRMCQPGRLPCMPLISDGACQILTTTRKLLFRTRLARSYVQE